MPVFIVAEIGVNHGGSVGVGMDLIDKAAEAKVDAVKFQLWTKETFPHLEGLRLDQEAIGHLGIHASKCKLDWFCTAFDHESVDYLASIPVSYWKVPNNDTVWTDPKLVTKISEQKAEFFFVSVSPTRHLPYWLFEIFPQEKTWGLHCVSRYPTPPDDAQLRKLGWRTALWGKGISDHSGLPEIPIAAVALGAKVVECHITLDKNAEGPDHKASLTPDEFSYMVKAIRNVEQAIA